MLTQILHKKSIAVIIVLALLLFIFLYFYSQSGTTTQSITMELHIVKKDHYIKPGEYMKMWVIGYNANDNSPNRKEYKVMIKDSKIYNLLETDKDYFVNLNGVRKPNQSEYIYTFDQLGQIGGTQLAGVGKIE